MVIRILEGEARVQGARWAGLGLPLCGGGNSSGGATSGGGGGTGTEAGTYTITVSASAMAGSTALSHTTKLTLVVQ